MTPTTRTADSEAASDPPCGWCGRPVAQPPTGRPRRYCKGAHRQAAYAARRRARELGLGEGEVVLSRRQLESAQARLTALRDALEEVSATLTASTGTQGYRDALRRVRGCVDDLDDLWVAPDLADEDPRSVT